MSKEHIGPEPPVSRSGQPWAISPSRDIRYLRVPAHVNQITLSSRNATFSARLKAQMPSNPKRIAICKPLPFLSAVHFKAVIMTVRFKFRSSVDFDSIDINGRSSISVRDLRVKIVQQKNLKICDDFDLVISDADTSTGISPSF